MADGQRNETEKAFLEALKIYVDSDQLEPGYVQTIINRWEKRTGKKAVKLV